VTPGLVLVMLVQGVEALQRRQCWAAVTFAQSGRERTQRHGQSCQYLNEWETIF
jgi:hypothetical protein